MDIIETRSGDTLVFDIVGRLDTNTSAEFEKQVIGRIESGQTDIVIDFERLHFVSSAGMRVLLMAAKRVRAAKGRMILCGLVDEVRSVFEMSGFLAILTVVPSRREALLAAV